jgi:hypothetical protein
MTLEPKKLKAMMALSRGIRSWGAVQDLGEMSDR